MHLLKIISEEQIPIVYNDTPIGELIRYQNLSAEFRACKSARLLVGMCMDNRKQLRIPENFAYIIRTGGANLRYCEFNVSYAIAISGVKYISLIAHNNCGMVNLVSQKESFIQGLCKNAGWDKHRAEEHFIKYACVFEIDNEVEFVVKEAKRIKEEYPRITVVPLFYSIEDNMISLVSE